MELISLDKIQNRIYTIRGHQVMLDKDLASFYEVKPIRLREQIKRNPNRFPDDFVFVLTENEIDFMVSQNAIPSKQSPGGSLPFVFTEQGVAAVAGVIKSEKADAVSVAIARAFVKNPDIIIADEPTASLDQKNGEAVVDHLFGINKKFGTTIIVASHDPMVLRHSPKIISLIDGEIQKGSL